MFKSISSRFALLALPLTLALTVSVSAQAVPLYTAVQNGQLGLFGLEGHPQWITEPGQWADIRAVTYSADGHFIAYIGLEAGPAGATHLELYDRTTNTTREIARDLVGNISSSLPVSFTLDSESLVYATDTENPAKIDVHVQSLTEAAQAKTVTLQYGRDCGGGYITPPEIQYTRETEGLGGASTLLQLTPLGLVYSLDCSGTQSALVDLSGGAPVTVRSVDGLFAPVVSPDGTKVAGRPMGNQSGPAPLAIRIWDLVSGKTSDVPLQSTADRLAWSRNGASLYYSIRAFDVGKSLTATQIPLVEPYLGTTQYVKWESILEKVDIATGKVTSLWHQPAFAIGRILPADEDVYFTVIPNVDPWIDALTDGSYDPQADATGEGALALTPISLWRLPLTGTPQQIAVNVNHTTLNP